MKIPVNNHKTLADKNENCYIKFHDNKRHLILKDLFQHDLAEQ